MWNFSKVADFCWDGLTLKHVPYKRIVVPYILLLTMGLIFELFLVSILVLFAFLFQSFGYHPTFQYYICIAITGFLFMMTLPILFTTVKRENQ